MDKQKRKNGAFRPHTWLFIALWTASSALIWAGYSFWINLAFTITHWSQNRTERIALSTIILLTALIQVQLVERLLKRPMRGWMLYTLIGAIITLFTFPRIGPLSLPMIGSMLLPTALVQTIWLWRNVRAALIWPLASLIGCFVFLQGILTMVRWEPNPTLWAGLGYGLIQGSAMLYLWMQARDTEKAKVDFATDDIGDKARERLQEGGAATNSQGYADEKAAQDRAR